LAGASPCEWTAVYLTAGCDTMDACDAATSSICAFPRSAMKRCPAGGMARSSVPSRYHDGMDPHPGGPEGVAAAAPLQGRWVAAITAAVSGSTSAANVSGNSSRSRYRSTPSLPSGFKRHGSQRRRHQTVPEGLGLQELLDA